MKKYVFLLMAAVCMFASCSTDEPEVLKGDSLYGHWEWCDMVDVNYQPVTPDHTETLFLEKDHTWEKYRDGKLESKGSFLSAKVEHFLAADGYDLGEYDYLEFTDENGSIQREYFEYRKEEDRLVFIGTPGYVGLPFKMWKRVR